MEDIVSELQELLREKYESGVTARLECRPRAAVPGTLLTVRAVIFANAKVLARWTPVVRSDDLEGFGVKVLKEGRSFGGVREYTTRFRSKEVKAAEMYRLTLHPSPEADPIASCSVHIFSRSVAAALSRQLREILAPAPARGEAAPRRRRRR